jgi:hypothetical protein
MLAVVGVIALAVLAGAGALWPRGEPPRSAAAGQADSTRLVPATLTKVTRVDCPEADPGVPGSICIKVTAQLAGGRQIGFDTTDPTGGMFHAGQRARLAVSEQPDQPPTTTSRTWNGADPCSPWPPCSWGPWSPSGAGRASAP